MLLNFSWIWLISCSMTWHRSIYTKRNNSFSSVPHCYCVGRKSCFPWVMRSSKRRCALFFMFFSNWVQCENIVLVFIVPVPSFGAPVPLLFLFARHMMMSPHHDEMMMMTPQYHARADCKRFQRLPTVVKKIIEHPLFQCFHQNQEFCTA